MPLKSTLLALLVAVVWGLNFVVIRIGLNSFPPFFFVGLRFTLTALPAVFFLKRPAVKARWVIAVGLFMSAGQFAFLFLGIDQGMPAGLASLVLQLQVVFTILFAMMFLGEHPGLGQLLGIGVAFSGIALIGFGRAADIPLVAFFLVILAALSWGIGNVCVRIAKPPNAVNFFFWSCLVPPIPLFILSFLFEGPDRLTQAISSVNSSGLLSLAYIVLISTVFGYTTWTWLLKHHEAARVTPFALCVPVVGILSAWAFLGEKPSPLELCGGGIVLIGLALCTQAMRRTTGAKKGSASLRRQ